MDVDETLAKKAAVADELMRSLIDGASGAPSSKEKRKYEMRWGQEQEVQGGDGDHGVDDDDEFAPRRFYASSGEPSKPAASRLGNNNNGRLVASPKRARYNARASDEDRCCVRVIGVPAKKYLSQLLDLFSQYGDIVKYIEAGSSTLHIQFSTAQAAQAAVADTASRNSTLGGFELTAHMIPKMDYQDPERRNSTHQVLDDLPLTAARKRRATERIAASYPQSTRSYGAPATSQWMMKVHDNINHFMGNFDNILAVVFGNDLAENE
eukprot:TRINITY_DN2734_c0_g1_i1.p1 TRINITY_DN2734_c0_g1~~TRINITY_DN2734_c0_g1_i1.p1  ORF type:complete len:266 (+),score=58.68 TRINITY_DN2734_c0_g1_i1:84-881(+)